MGSDWISSFNTTLHYLLTVNKLDWTWSNMWSVIVPKSYLQSTPTCACHRHEMSRCDYHLFADELILTDPKLGWSPLIPAELNSDNDCISHDWLIMWVQHVSNQLFFSLKQAEWVKAGGRCNPSLVSAVRSTWVTQGRSRWKRGDWGERSF